MAGLGVVRDAELILRVIEVIRELEIPFNMVILGEGVLIFPRKHQKEI